MDLSGEAIKLARELYPSVTFFEGDLFSHDFQEVCYDVVISSEVIEHVDVDKRLDFIDRITYALKPGGWLTLTTPNKAQSDALGKSQLIENHFSEQELKNLVEEDFEIELFTTIHRVMPRLGHRYRTFQVLRAIIYDVLRLRRHLENPFRSYSDGLYFVLLARRKA